MIHQAFQKNDEGDLAPQEQTWVIECEDGDSRGYENLDAVFSHLDTGIQH
jgi:hypothetical protein